MTETYGFFADGTGDERVYTQADLARMFRLLARDGVSLYDAQLAVAATTPASLAVTVGTGMANVQGYWYRNDATKTLALAAADPASPRIDRVVVQLDPLAGRTITVVAKTGTPAAEPEAPALEKSAAAWEIALADVLVEAGASVAGTITDQRPNTSLCGYIEPLFVSGRSFFPTGSIAMNGQRIEGMAEPGGDDHAATKGYVDDAIAAAILAHVAAEH